MSPSWFLGLFFVSGFCSLLCEIVWLRLAMGVFGVTAPFVALFLAVFMGALGMGSWLGGRLCRRLSGRAAATTLRLYAALELAIGASALAVPALLGADRSLMSGAFAAMGWGSAGFYAASALLVAATLTPWCLCMGMTFPFAMTAIRARFPERSSASFSYLYVANVTGACAGTLASAFVLIETFGFRGTLLASAALNAAVAAAAFALSLSPSMTDAVEGPAAAAPARAEGRGPLVLLFLAGFVAMGLEVIWTREFMPYLGTTIYAFAAVLAVYLAATFLGSATYRAALRRRPVSDEWAWIVSWPLAALALPAADPFLAPGSILHVSPAGRALRVVFGLGPFCALLGFLTPSLVDRWSGGDPERAGTAYAVNVLGCVLGPLAAGFCLLPFMPERLAVAVMALPLLGAGLAAARRLQRGAPVVFGLRALPVFALITGLTMLLPFISSTYEEGVASLYRGTRILRDYQASVIAGRNYSDTAFLLVNGVGMTALTPVTKYMAHLPLAFMTRPPRKALVICFGMGTTFRSLLSWGIEATAVELVPSVPRFFGFFHADAARALAEPNGRVVIDDGRRFLERTHEVYDVITLDPAPPMEAAGTAFLFSKEFYALAARRLAPDGILQAWLVEPVDDATMAAFVDAARESFPYARAFHSVLDKGYHLLLSRRPIPDSSAAELARRLPPAAAADLTEFGPQATAREQFQLALDRETPLDSIAKIPSRPLTDDRPVNEYYFLRRSLPAFAPSLR